MICSSCGAPLNRDSQGGFATCEFCGLQPQPQRALDPGGSLNADLAQVEQWWIRERRRFMTPDRQGNLHPPEEEHVGHVVVMVLGMVLGLLAAFAGHGVRWGWLGMAGFFLFPILITLPAALLHQRAERRFKDFKRLEAEYQGRRNGIIDRHARRS